MFTFIDPPVTGARQLAASKTQALLGQIDKIFWVSRRSRPLRAPGVDSTVRLDSERHPLMMSRCHVESPQDLGEFMVVELASLTGTYVNGKPVDIAAVATGDELRSTSSG